MLARMIIALAATVPTVALAQFMTRGGSVAAGPNTVVTLSNGAPVTMLHNPAAANPSFDRLMTFLKSDTTCEHRYIDGEFTCVEFALMLHDNAERAGLRAAYVLVAFDKGIGHALAAFETTDRGRVFVDPTGDKDRDHARHFVALAYLEKGKPYGILPLEIGQNNPNHYPYFAQILAEHEKLASWRHQIERESADLQAAAASLANEGRALSSQAQANGYAGAAAALRMRQDRIAEEFKRWTRANEKIGVSLTLENTSPVKSFTVVW
jgi:hypothetical protein